MDKREEAQGLRDDAGVHYNCCQAVLAPYAEECGIERETALGLGAHFGSGMRCGSACGALTGALMVLGMAGKGEAEAKRLMNAFREKNTYLNCAELLKKAGEDGVPRKPHCDGMVRDAVGMLEEILREG